MLCSAVVWERRQVRADFAGRMRGTSLKLHRGKQEAAVLRTGSPACTALLCLDSSLEVSTSFPCFVLPQHTLRARRSVPTLLKEQEKQEVCAFV